MRHGFRRFDPWRTSHDLLLRIYRESWKLPRREQPALAEQLRALARAVPRALAAGCRCRHDVDFARHLRVARSVCLTLACQLALTRELEWIGERSGQRLLEETIALARRLGELQRSVTREMTVPARRRRV